MVAILTNCPGRTSRVLFWVGDEDLEDKSLMGTNCSSSVSCWGSIQMNGSVVDTRRVSGEEVGPSPTHMEATWERERHYPQICNKFSLMF